MGLESDYYLSREIITHHYWVIFNYEVGWPLYKVFYLFWLIIELF
jgi:hypothetical protein